MGCMGRMGIMASLFDSRELVANRKSQFAGPALHHSPTPSDLYFLSLRCCGVEAAEAADFGPDQSHSDDDQHGADAAGNDREDRVGQLRDQTGFEATQLVGGADEEAVD